MRTRKLFWSICYSAFIFHGFISAQEKERFVLEVKPFPGQPLQIVGKTVGNKRSDSEGRVIAGQDWLKDFRIEFKNISKKNVTYVNINLEIAASGTMAYPLVVPVIYRAGEDPFLIAKHQNSLLPGQVTSVGVVYYPQAFVMLNHFDVHDVTNTTLSIRQVEFDDNTMWNCGFENRRDPTNPDKWILVSKPLEPKVSSVNHGIESFRQTPEADAQGKTRFERAAYMFEKIKAANPKTKWRIFEVPGIAHDKKGMAIGAQKIWETLK